MPVTIVGRIVTADDGRVWDLGDAVGEGVRTDPDSTTHPESEWSPEELVAAVSWRAFVAGRSIRSDIADAIDQLLVIQSGAQDDEPVAEAAKLTMASLEQQWSARQLQVENSTPAVALGYITAIRDQVAVSAGQHSITSAYIADLEAWRVKVDQHLGGTLIRCLIGLARIVANRLIT